MTIPLAMPRLAALAAALVVLGPLAALAQETEPEQVDLPEEDRLRQHLLKLEWRGVTQLLRWEQRVDRVQKTRANTSSNPQELALLSDDEDAGVRFYVAANRHTPLGTRLALATDEEATVRAGVAMSLAYDPLASSAIVEATEHLALALARDNNVLVRLVLLENGRLPEALFDTLATDPDPIVRLRVAEGLYTPAHVLATLSADSVATVQLAAVGHANLPLSRLSELSFSPDPVLRMAVCGNVNTPSTVLDSLAADAHPGVRQLVASHPNTPLGTLVLLAGDPDVNVVMAVAEHPSAGRQLLTRLAFDDRDGGIRMAAQRRLEPLLRREIREDILERYDSN